MIREKAHKVDSKRVAELEELYDLHLIDFQTWTEKTLEAYGYDPSPGQMIEYKTDIDLAVRIPHNHGIGRLQIRDGLMGSIIMVKEAPEDSAGGPTSTALIQSPWGRFISWLKTIRITWKTG